MGFVCRSDEGVEIGVANTGRRIPVELRERIFEKFFRAEESGMGNSGLGLTFCKHVVAAHGGRIMVRDTPDWPTYFSISLPGQRSC